MLITAIPKDKCDILISMIRENSEKLGYEVTISRIVKKRVCNLKLRFRRKTPTYHTILYDLCDNYVIRPLDNIPIAVNRYYYHLYKCRKSRYLQVIDWMVVDELLNCICDYLNIPCSIMSGKFLVRVKGRNVWKETSLSFFTVKKEERYLYVMENDKLVEIRLTRENIEKYIYNKYLNKIEWIASRRVIKEI